MGDTGNKKTKLLFYLLFVAVCIGLCFFNYYYNTKRFEDSQQQIIRAFERSMRSCEQIIPHNAYRQVETISAANQKHQEEVKVLLELQFNKIQNEYETQEVWTGILTIVFLIFSFYSLFKSEEMERQGKIALHSIEESEKGAKTAFGSIETDKKNKLEEIKTEYAQWKNEEVAKFSKIIEDTQTKSITTMRTEIKSLTEQLEIDYRSQATQYATILKKSSDEIIEGLMKQNAEQITLFVKSLEDKNAQEIQKQVDLWTSKMSNLKKEYEQALNDIYEEHNPAQTVEDTDSDIHSEEDEETVMEKKPEDTINSLDVDEESDERLPIESYGTK